MTLVAKKEPSVQCIRVCIVYELNCLWRRSFDVGVALWVRFESRGHCSLWSLEEICGQWSLKWWNCSPSAVYSASSDGSCQSLNFTVVSNCYYKFAQFTEVICNGVCKQEHKWQFAEELGTSAWTKLSISKDF